MPASPAEDKKEATKNNNKGLLFITSCPRAFNLVMAGFWALQGSVFAWGFITLPLGVYFAQTKSNNSIKPPANKTEMDKLYGVNSFVSNTGSKGAP